MADKPQGLDASLTALTDPAFGAFRPRCVHRPATASSGRPHAASPAPLPTRPCPPAPRPAAGHRRAPQRVQAAAHAGAERVDAHARPHAARVQPGGVRRAGGARARSHTGGGPQVRRCWAWGAPRLQAPHPRRCSGCRGRASGATSLVSPDLGPPRLPHAHPVTKAYVSLPLFPSSPWPPPAAPT